jgi:hypothetical protein
MMMVLILNQVRGINFKYYKIELKDNVVGSSNETQFLDTPSSSTYLISSLDDSTLTGLGNIDNL